MLALRVPCDARMSRRNAELAIAQTDASRTPRPILCFSASLNGGGWRSRTKDKRLRIKGLSQNTTTSGISIPAWF